MNQRFHLSGAQRIQLLFHLCGLLTLTGRVLGEGALQVTHPLPGENARLVVGVGATVGVAARALAVVDGLALLGERRIECLRGGYEGQGRVMRGDGFDLVVAELRRHVAHIGVRAARVALAECAHRAGSRPVLVDPQGIGMDESVYTGDRGHVIPLADAIGAVAAVAGRYEGVQVGGRGRAGQGNREQYCGTECSVFHSFRPNIKEIEPAPRWGTAVTAVDLAGIV